MTRAEAAASPLVKSLLSERGANGMIPRHPYHKFCGARWVLACLAEVSYPPGDLTLCTILEQSYAWLLPDGKAKQLQSINGRVRGGASLAVA